MLHERDKNKTNSTSTAPADVKSCDNSFLGKIHERAQEPKHHQALFGDSPVKATEQPPSGKAIKKFPGIPLFQTMTRTVYVYCHTQSGHSY